ncbi:MAG: hypothetical protein NNA22_10640 [Nitrospira sp.]|nr:hypothetical protein [Nitrospira sp.]
MFDDRHLHFIHIVERQLLGLQPSQFQVAISFPRHRDRSFFVQVRDNQPMGGGKLIKSLPSIQIQMP